MIELKNLTKEYGSMRVVDTLSLTIQKGSVFGFLGPNGAGKTTTIKMIVNIISPTSGSVTIDGKTPAEKSTRQIMGFMPENPSFYDHLTGVEFLRFCAELSGKFSTPAQELDVLLDRAGILEAKDRRMRTYSKGMKQRLGFAQALVHNPEYVLLDEPLDGLDPIGRMEMKKIIKQIRQEGKTIFFNSHILSDVEELCDDIGIIHKGRLLYSGGVPEFCRGRPLEEKFVSLILSTNEKATP